MNLACVAEALVVRPGDTLIVRVPPDIGRDQAQEVKVRLDEWVAEHLPGVAAVVIAAEQIAVYRPEQVAVESCST